MAAINDLVISFLLNNVYVVLLADTKAARIFVFDLG